MSVSVASSSVLSRRVCRCALLQLAGRTSSAANHVVSSRVRWCSTVDPIPTPPADGGPKVYPDKLKGIVQDISALTLLEVSQLNELLKSTLNIPDAPVMAAAAAVPAGAPAEEAQPKEDQSKFTVKLVSFTDTSKVKLIKEVKVLMEGMNLVQAKKFVESAPQVVKEDINKEEAENLKTVLEAVGGVVSID